MDQISIKKTKTVKKSISLNNTNATDMSLEVVLKIILIYKINQKEFAVIHVAISKCQINKIKRIWIDRNINGDFLS